MDLAILSSAPGTIPEGTDPALWVRYVRGSRAFDQLYGSGSRCPNNQAGARCRCDIPRDEICRYWHGVEGIAKQIGGVVAEITEKME